MPDYATAIDRLAALGILPPDFAHEFRTVAGFRNVLVHGYLEVDVAVLHAVLTGKLADFVTFAGHIEQHLSATP